MLKKIFINLLILTISAMPVLAFDLDMSVDDTIKKQYDTGKLEQDVLNNNINQSQKQSIKNSTSKSLPSATLDYSPTPMVITKADNVYTKKIPQWTTFTAKSNQAISGYSRKGTKVSFTTTENIYKKEVTIPAGTKFYGEIVNSHGAQSTGNGALVVLKIISMTYNGTTYQVRGKITKAKSKKIFFNNIKGHRQYIAGIGKQIDKGENFYKKTRRVSSKMSDNPILVILSPIPTLVGFVSYAGCTALSPITALTTKGGNLNLPAGSVFEIKLLDRVYVK